MGKKGSMSEEQDEPEAKKRRTINLAADLSTDEVEIFKNSHNIKGIVLTGTFASKLECHTIKHIKQRIDRDDELSFGYTKKFHLYPAFTEALLRLLGKIEEALTDEACRVRMLLIHGVPDIGMTSLAECLSYFLALFAGEKETVHYIQLSHSAKANDSVITNLITNACNHKYLVVDQVNTNALKCSEMVQCLENRLAVGKTRMPLILFTSGHYTPTDEWLNLQKTGLLCYKLITMRIQAPLLGKLRGLMEVPQGDDVISNHDLLKVTTCYSRMVQCLNHLRFLDSSAGKDALESTIYPGADLLLVERQSAVHFIWLAWQELLLKGLPPLDQLSEDECTLSAHHVEYLGFLISEIKGTRDQGINVILNLMDITGNQQYERHGYTEFKADCYRYKFLHKKRLHEVLRFAVKTNEGILPEEKYKMLLSAFLKLTKEGNTQYQYLRCELFELIIKTICDIEAKAKEHPVGMMLLSAGLDFVKVDRCETVATELELCRLPLKYESAEERRMSFWCVLNMTGKQPFKGFDFAFLETRPHENKPVLEKLQLFQITVNPEGKGLDSKLSVTDVLDNITTELVKLKLMQQSDADWVVVPYFVHPSSENKKTILPCRNSQRSITVEIVGFPKNLLSSDKCDSV